MLRRILKLFDERTEESAQLTTLEMGLPITTIRLGMRLRRSEVSSSRAMAASVGNPGSGHSSRSSDRRTSRRMTAKAVPTSQRSRSRVSPVCIFVVPHFGALQTIIVVKAATGRRAFPFLGCGSRLYGLAALATGLTTESLLPEALPSIERAGETALRRRQVGSSLMRPISFSPENEEE